ncbi:hypothetical protein EAF00_004833 [Botryotinia globosa]|nr:hypothetical protein EAF00_004833 [Botryotinia globosa]
MRGGVKKPLLLLNTLKAGDTKLKSDSREAPKNLDIEKSSRERKLGKVNLSLTHHTPKFTSNRLPFFIAGYSQYPQPWPPRTVSEWNEYHRLQSIHEAKRNAYNQALDNQVVACALEGNSKRPYSELAITSDGHAALEQPARRWKEGAQNHGNARQAFVDRYPHGYPSPQDNENHRRIAQNQLLDAERAQQTLEIHRQYGFVSR